MKKDDRLKLGSFVSEDQNNDDKFIGLERKIKELETFGDTLVIQADEWCDIQNQKEYCIRDYRQRSDELYDISFKRFKEESLISN